MFCLEIEGHVLSPRLRKIVILLSKRSFVASQLGYFPSIHSRKDCKRSFELSELKSGKEK